MIVEFFLYIGYTIISWIMDLLPSYTGMPSGVNQAVGWFSGKVQGISCFMPMDTMWTILSLSISIAIGVMVFRFFAWLFKWKARDHA